MSSTVLAPVQTCRILARCRVCRRELRDLYAYRPLPLVNDYCLTADHECPRYPLTLAQCMGCGLVQIREEIGQSVLYGGDYNYIPSTARTMVEHFAALAQKYARPGLRILDIGSNDGTLLAAFKAHGCEVQGIEPAPNVARLAEEKGVPTEVGLFDEETELGEFDVITATNLLANTHNIPSVLRGIRKHLHTKGRVVIETPDWNCLKRIGSYDSVYHEHMAYFTEQTLDTALLRYGLTPVAHQRQTVHGGSLRTIAVKGEYVFSRRDIEDHADFDPRRTADALAAWLAAQEQPVVGYGAPAKAAVLLSEVGYAEGIRLIADTVPFKQGKFLPGVHIPIVADLPDAQDVLVLCWNFREEVMQKLRGRNLTFPIPRLETVCVSA